MLNWFLRRSQPNFTRWLPKILLAATLGWKLLSICERSVLLLRPYWLQPLMLNVGAAGPTERWMPSTFFTSRPRLGGRIALLLRQNPKRISVKNVAVQMCVDAEVGGSRVT